MGVHIFLIQEGDFLFSLTHPFHYIANCGKNDFKETD